MSTIVQNITWMILISSTETIAVPISLRLFAIAQLS